MDYKLNLLSPWEDVKEKIKEIDFNLTDEDLAYKPGEDEALINRIADKTGKSVIDTKGWIESVSFTKGVSS